MRFVVKGEDDHVDVPDTRELGCTKPTVLYGNP